MQIRRINLHCEKCGKSIEDHPCSTDNNRGGKISVAPVEITSSEWVEELARRLERRIKPVFRAGIQIPLAGGDADAAIRETLRILIEELRACAESSSTRQDQPRVSGQNYEYRTNSIRELVGCIVWFCA